MANNSIILPFSKKYPQIYAYSLEEIYPGCIKVGYTTRKDVKTRIDEQFKIEFPDGTKPYKLLLSEDAFDNNGNSFDDHIIHKVLVDNGAISRGGEWFECSLKDVEAAIVAVKNHIKNIEKRTQTFKPRPEQQKAIDMTVDYFNTCKGIIEKPHFLWNAKMRFGKTFTTYQLAKKMNWNRVLILTYKPAVESSWKEDLYSHIDFEGWQFVSKDSMKYEECDISKPIICFGSLQDYLGKTEDGSIKPKNEWVHKVEWDCIVFDEYHYGAWRSNTKELVDDLDENVNQDFENINDKNIPIPAKHFLFLSGTPFKVLDSGEFSEEQIYNWTYSDEQKAKEEWIGENNPYKSMPQLIMMTYKLPEDIAKVATKGEFDEFDLNEFFKANYIDETKEKAEFLHKNEVQKWIEFIIGQDIQRSIDNKKLAGNSIPKMPFDDADLKSLLQHTIWFLPDVASCYAMYDLLKSPANTYFNQYKIVLCAGNKCGNGVDAKIPLDKAIGKNPLKSQTITLTCGKLTTGVTVKPWSGIFMLRSCKSPETYFQAAFRVQSPWTIKDENGKIINLKEQCFVFDFAPNRALSQIATYCNNTNKKNDKSIEQVVSDFIKFLPVLAYGGIVMEQVDAAGLLDIAMGRTTATLLAKGWNNALLVNVDNDTLKELMDNEHAMDVISSIESFRNPKEEIGVIVNKTNALNELKTKEKQEGLTEKEKKEKKQLEQEVKDANKKRDDIRKKLQALATRIPLFIYLADDRREATLQNIIYPLEPDLFKKVTGITHEDFEILKDIGLFNPTLMNNAIYDFRKYEEDSLRYTGIEKHLGEDVGGYDTTLTEKEFKELK